MTLRLTNFDAGCETDIARERNYALSADDYAETVENERKRSCDFKVKKNSDKVPGKYTMKIVLTMTVDAHNREQAEILAGHVAAFLPEDAERVAEAFTPVIMAPRSGDGNRAKAPMATAEVITVVSEAPVRSESPGTDEGNTLAFAGRVPNGLQAGASDVRMHTRSGSRRTSIYTRATCSG